MPQWIVIVLSAIVCADTAYIEWLRHQLADREEQA